MEETYIPDDIFNKYVERQNKLNQKRVIDFIYFREKVYRSIKGGEYKRYFEEDDVTDYDYDDYELE